MDEQIGFFKIQEGQILVDCIQRMTEADTIRTKAAIEGINRLNRGGKPVNEEKSKDIVLETKRLILRKMREDDFENVRRFLADPEVMYAYEHGFDDQEVRDWIANNQRRYREYGFGLWLMIDKKTGQSIGDCGITWQMVNETPVLEIGYHLEKEKWHHGYAIEAARACKAYAFETLGADRITSIIRDTNSASQKVAVRNGMKPVETIIKHYRGFTMPHLVYEITREQCEADQKDSAA